MGIRPHIIGILLLVVSLTVVRAQDAPAPAQAAFLPYQCTFQTETNSAQIRAVLMGSNGQPVPADSYTIQITPVSSGQPLTAEKVQIAPVSDRPPLQMILVLDITETVPLEQLVNAISTHLSPQLNVQDQVALLAFSETVSPLTQFYTDKNRLINEHMIDLPTLGGDNRVYDALLQAVSSFPFNNQARKVVLLITDSGRRNFQQTPSDAIISKAQSEQVEVYPIGFYSRDKPDVEELQAIANGTGGFGWFYTDKHNTRSSIEAAVSGDLDSFIRTLNSEIALKVDMQGLTADASGRVPFNIAVNPQNETPLSGQVSCPVEVLNHSITFIDQFDNKPVTGKVDIGVAVNSDLSPDELKIVFRVNDKPVQNSTSTIYTFDAGGVYPGYYTIGAQLWDHNNETLATTPTAIRLYAQQKLQLDVVSGTPSALSGPVRFEVSTNPDFALPAAQLTIAPVTDASKTLPLGSVSFGSDGRAALAIDDIAARIKTLYPNATPQDSFQVSAYVSGVSPDDPKLAYSNDLLIGVAGTSQTVQPMTAVAVTPPVDPVLAGAVVISALLLLINYWLIRAVGRKRVQRLINNPDRHELSPQLMTLTVHRGDTRQPYTLTKKTMTIGRGSSNDINLGDDPSISRQHGVVMWRRKGWYYSNRKGQVMTRINGKRRRGLMFYKLEPVTELEIGHTLLLFHANTQQDISDFIKTNL
jgi:von Willebrand factor type A domain-containing protein/type III secretion system (T3SS) inner membrane Yop/YscD-like protein